MRLLVIAVIFTLTSVTTIRDVQAAENPSAASVRIVPNDDNKRVFDIQLWTRRDSFAVGDPLTLYARLSHTARVYVFFTDSHGNTRRIFPNAYDQQNRLSGGRVHEIPGKDSYRFIVEPPAGPGTITAYAIRDPNQAYGSLGDDYRYGAFPRSSSPSSAMSDRLQGLHRYADYAFAKTRITVRGSSRKSPPREYGRLTITSSPSGAAVYIDGQYAGTTTYRTSQIRRGRHSIYLYHPGYEAVQREIEITPGENTRLSFRLQPAYGYLYDGNDLGYWW